MEVSKILVVDYQEPDLELLVRQIFRKKIQAHEIQFLFVHSGDEALAILNKDLSIEIVLTDVKMRLENNQELLAVLPQLKRSIKTIVITPYGDIESIRTAMNRGAFDFVTRPINLKELELSILKTMDQVIRTHEVEKVQSTLIDIEKELDVAKSIQNSILPHDFSPFPDVKTFEIYGSMLPAKRVGGDFFDFFPIDPHLLAFTIADVSGKGVPAALFMTMTRGLLRALGQKTRSPVDCIRQLNELMTLENESSMFVTAFYGIFDAKNGEIEYCNAGHNPPYVIDQEGQCIQIGRSEGVALGITKDDSYFVKKKIDFKKNETLILYTDGVTEAMNIRNELFQEFRLEKILKEKYKLPLPILFEEILADVKTFSGEREQSDDITLFGLRNSL